MRSTSFFVFVMLLLVMVGSAGAQNSLRPAFDHPLTAQMGAARPRPHVAAVAETLSILAAMVEFRPDEDGRTTGNGTFEMTEPVRRIIDPAPHDSGYFAGHLTFLENYYRKASNGACIVVTRLLPAVYRVNGEMKSYSPSRTSTTNIELGNLIAEAWHLIDSSSPGIPFASYDAFILFHAGTGRDIDLTSIYGYDPRPFDLPSLYVSLPSLKKMFGESYLGIPVNGGTAFVTNSMIIPETESRDLDAIGGTSRLQLGINGLLAASVGSHLGLPDLFDTKTGRSGIGRFGLMDGQSIFSWSGLFPPEPSAWEKYFLGWISPITITGDSARYVLPAVTMHGAADTVYRVLISEKEYFLIENRNRDANGDSARITFLRNGETVELVWPRDTTGFTSFNQDSLYGVVVDVDEFDWSLPGGVTRSGEFFDGGILIWHIDETVIDATYATNGVNANPDRRGVDVEEADGSQDIGQSYGLLDPGAGSEDGTPLDYWYAGNTSTVRKRLNAFSPVSLPGSLSYGLANSHITVNDFSARGGRMSLSISVGDDDISFLPGFPKATDRVAGKRAMKSYPASNAYSQAIVAATDHHGPAKPGAGGVVVPRPGSAIFAWTGDGLPLPGLRSDGMVVQSRVLPAGNTFTGTPVVLDVRGDGTIDLAIATHGEDLSGGGIESLESWMLADGDADSLADSVPPGALARKASCPAVAGDSVIAIGTEGGMVTFFGASIGAGRTISTGDGDTSAIVGISLLETGGRFVVVSANGTVSIVDEPAVSSSVALRKACANPAVTGVISSSSSVIVLATLTGDVYLFDRNLNVVPGFPVATGDVILNAPALADIDGDGRRDIIVFSGNRIVALNASGAMVNNFPITLPTDSAIATSPVVADLQGDGKVEIIAVTREGLVCAYGHDRRIPDGFPLLTGPNSGSTPVVFYRTSPCLSCADIALAVASDDGHVYGWKTGSIVVGPAAPPAQPWPQYMYDAANSGRVLTPLLPVSRTSEFLPASLAYNWPNPVGPSDDNLTRIRFYLSADAAVSIKIFDLAGQLVEELQIQGKGGMDNEVMWHVADVGSGVYFARINAEGSGQSGSAVVKVAVVK